MTEFFRQFRAYEPVVDLVRLGCFLAFVALGLLTAWRLRRGTRTPRAVDPFILFALALSIGVGLVQQESWPFTTWALVHNISPRRASTWEMIAFDAANRPCRVDARIFQPVSPEDFGSWMFGRFPQLGPEGQANVGRFVLARAEAARRRVRGGGAIATNDWVLGPLSAPYTYQSPAIWRSSGDVPELPFTRLQIWVIRWDVEERFEDDRRVTRELLVEFKDGP